MRRALSALALLGALVLALATPAAGAAAQRASFTQIEDDLMCVACHESLAVAQSPEAFSERQYVRTLIAQGATRRQIERDMVAQYGPAVLAKPPASGFGILVYIIPPLVLVLGVLTVAVTLPRWRRRSHVAGGRMPSAPHSLSIDDARRLDEELSRHA